MKLLSLQKHERKINSTFDYISRIPGADLIKRHFKHFLPFIAEVRAWDRSSNILRLPLANWLVFRNWNLILPPWNNEYNTFV